MIRSFIAAGFAATLVLSATAAVADPPPAASAPAVVPPATGTAPEAPRPAARNPDTDMVCKTEETTGSRLGAKRTCLTRAQWAARSAAGKEALEDLRKDRGFVPK